MTKVLKNEKFWLLLVCILVFVSATVSGCSKENAQQNLYTDLTDKLDPAEWGKVFPNQYQSYLTNSETGSDHSKYRGSDNFDRNSAWPFQWVLSDGWGMGVEYTESRGHTFALVDQLEIAPERKKAGGSCLTCKSSMVPKLQKELGKDYFQLSYDEVYKQIPEGMNTVGVACIDCHDPKTMKLNNSRWTLKEGLDTLKNVPAEFTKSQQATLVCAQCHVTYSIPKDENKKSTDLLFPWANSKWEGITIEDIEKQIKEQGLYEWTHNVTGLKLGHIRHPEFELFTNNSPHYNMGLSCASCHMPEEEVNGRKYSSHQWTSPLKQGFNACSSCHDQTSEEMKEKVIAVQDEVNEMYTEAGFVAAQAAKAIEMANKTKGVDQALLDEAKAAYEKAYYRVTFIGAENSMGMHNPPEAKRVLGDGLKFAQEAETKARQAIKAAGINPPDKFDLELEKYPNKPELNKAADGRQS